MAFDARPTEPLNESARVSVDFDLSTHPLINDESRVPPNGDRLNLAEHEPRRDGPRQNASIVRAGHRTSSTSHTPKSPLFP